MLGMGNIAFEAARRSLGAHMLLMDVVSHNIANVNTPGYSRQRGVVKTTLPYGVPSMHYVALPGQLGTGVEVKYIQRLRNDFLDRQFRQENGTFGATDAKDYVYHILETLLQEPGENSLSSLLNEYYDAFQELSVTPEDPAIRSLVIERIKNLIGGFKHYAEQIVALRSEVDYQIRETVQQINSIARQIADLNGKIETALNSRQQPNDLLDQRDKLLDDLSQLMNIRVERLGNGGVAVFVGSMNIVDDRHVNPIVVIDNIEIDKSEVSDLTSATTKYISAYGSQGWNGDRVRYRDDSSGFTGADPYNSKVATLWVKFFEDSAEGTEKYVALDDRSLKSGKLAGLIEARDKILWNALEDLDKLVWGLTARANEIHRQGVDLNGDAGEDIFLVPDTIYTSSLPQDLIAELYAGNSSPYWRSSNFRGIALHIYLNPNLDGHPEKIAAAHSANPYPGDSTVAVALAQERSTNMGVESFDVNGYPFTLSSPANFTDDMKLKSTYEFYTAWVSGVGSASANNKILRDNTEKLKQALDLRRKQESGVNLDEEAADMIRFQKAYEAAARVLTVVTEMMDTVINLGAR